MTRGVQNSIKAATHQAYASAVGGRPGVPSVQAVSEQLKTLLGPLVMAQFRDDNGALYLKKLPAQNFSEFLEFLKEQVSIQSNQWFGLAHTRFEILSDPYAWLLGKQEYRPLLDLLWAESPHGGGKVELSQEGQGQLKTLLQRFRAELISIDADRYVKGNLENQRGVEQLRGLLLDPSGFSQVQRAKLLNAIAHVGKDEHKVLANHYEGITRQLSWLGIANALTPPEAFQQATLGALALLDSLQVSEAYFEYQGKGATERREHFLKQAKELGLDFWVNAEQSERMAALAKKEAKGDVIAEAEIHLSKLWLLAAEGEHWNHPEFKAQGKEIRQFILIHSQDLLDLAQGCCRGTVQEQEAKFQRFQHFFYEFLHNWSVDVGTGKGEHVKAGAGYFLTGQRLKSSLKPMTAQQRQAFEEAVQLSERWHYATEYGEKFYEPMARKGIGPEVAETDPLAVGKNHLIDSLNRAKQELWAGYGQKGALSKGIWLSVGKLGAGDQVKIRKACRWMDALIDRVKAAESVEQLRLEVAKLFHEAKPGGILNQAYHAAKMAGLEALLGTGEAALEFALARLVDKGAGLVVQGVRALRGVSQGKQVVESTLQASKWARRVEQGKAGLKVGFALGVSGELLAQASDQAGREDLNLKHLLISGFATGISMALTGAVFPEGEEAKRVFIKGRVLQALGKMATEVPLHVVSESAEELTDMLVSRIATGQTTPPSETEIKNTVKVCGASAGSKTGVLLEVLASGKKREAGGVKAQTEGVPLADELATTATPVKGYFEGLLVALHQAVKVYRAWADPYAARVMGSMGVGPVLGDGAAQSPEKVQVAQGQTVGDEAIHKIASDILINSVPGTALSGGSYPYAMAIKLLISLGSLEKPPQSIDQLAIDAMIESATPLIGKRMVEQMRWNALQRQIWAKVLGFSNSPKALDALLMLAEDEDVDVRRAVATALGKSNSPQAINALFKLAGDRTIGLRFEALDALGKSKSPEALNALLKLPEITDNGLHQRWVISLGGHHSPKALNILLKYAVDGNIYERWGAAEALGKSNTPQALSALLKLVEDAEYHVRREAAKALGKSNSPQALDALIRLTENEDIDVRVVAVEGLGLSNSSRAQEVLLRLLENKNIRVHKAAVSALGQSNSPQVLSAFLKLAKAEGAASRRLAAWVLGKSKSPEALNALLKLAQDESNYVLEATAEALGKSDSIEANEELWKLLLHENSDVIVAAASALGEQISRGNLATDSFKKLFSKTSNQEPLISLILYTLAKSGTPTALDILSACNFNDGSFLLEMWTDSFVQQRIAARSTSPAPHPAAKLSSLIRSLTAKFDPVKEGRGVGFQNRGIHRSAGATHSGFDFHELRELKPGDPVYGRPVLNNGKWHQVVKDERRGRNIHILVNPGLYGEMDGETMGVMGGTLAELGFRRQDPVGLLIGDGKGGHGVQLAAARSGRLEQIVGKALEGGEPRVMSALELLEQPILQKQLPRGSQIFLVSNFLNEPDLGRVEKILARYRKLGVEVVPIQAGSQMKVPEQVVMVGARRYPVAKEAQLEKQTAVAQARQAETEKFLKRQGGFVATENGKEGPEAIARRVIEGVGRGSGSTGVRVDIQFEGEEVRKILETIPPPEVMKRFKDLGSLRLVDIAEELLDLAKKARAHGWGIVLDWFDARRPTSSAFGSKQYFDDPKNHWGPTYEECLEIAGELLKQKNAEQDKTGLGLPLLSNLSSNPARSKEASSPSHLVAGSEWIDTKHTGAMDPEGSSKKYPVWMRLKSNLGKTASYLLTGVGGKYDPAHARYTAVPGLEIHSFAGGAVTQKVVGELTGQVRIEQMPVPLGGRVVKQTGRQVHFEITHPSPSADLMNMSLKDLKTRGPELYGDLYSTLTAAAPLEVIPEDVQKLLREIAGASVEQAIKRIQAFVIQNFEYRPFDEMERTLMARIQQQAEAGKLQGGEYLSFILAIRGGVCVELSEVTLWLMRMAGIPAVKGRGYVADQGEVTTEGHQVAMAVLPNQTHPQGKAQWSAMPVETSQQYVPDAQGLLEWAAAEEQKNAIEETPAPATKPEAPEGGSEAAGATNEKDLSTPHQGDSDTRAQLSGYDAFWQKRWEAADEAGRREISKAFEYYLTVLEFRGRQVWGRSVDEILLNADQYARFPQDTVSHPPGYWLSRIRAQNPTIQDVQRFKLLLERAI